jgi:kynurenine 3-monooxygenase
MLMNEAERQGVNILFSMRCAGIDFSNTGNVTIAGAGGVTTHNFDLITGADGAFSAVRDAMRITDRFDFSQQYIDHGYKELTIPPGPDGSFLLEKNALHIWPRASFMLIALPNPGGNFTCTLFYPFEGKSSFENLNSKKDVIDLFENQFPDALKIMPNLAADFFANPASSLVTIKCYPWVKNNTFLIGDAAHGIVPFYGQGMNAGFEDCYVLNQLLDRHEDNWEKTLPEYQALRKPDADAIARLALDNFIEMRDLVADDKFILRKKIEARLHALFPEKWIPLYSMVTFREDIRYSEALSTGTFQKRIMDKVMAQPDISSNWEQLDFKGIADQLKQP